MFIIQLYKESLIDICSTLVYTIFVLRLPNNNNNKLPFVVLSVCGCGLH